MTVIEGICHLLCWSKLNRSCVPTDFWGQSVAERWVDESSGSGGNFSVYQFAASCCLIGAMETSLLTEEFASSSLREIQQKAKAISEAVAAPRAQEVDELQVWPAHSMDALGKAGLLGLHVPKRLGGLGQGLMGLIAVTEQLGQVSRPE